MCWLYYRLKFVLSCEVIYLEVISRNQKNLKEHNFDMAVSIKPNLTSFMWISSSAFQLFVLNYVIKDLILLSLK